MKITHGEKEAAYREIATKAVDYIRSCADRNVAPLKHDANLFATTLNQVKCTGVRR